MTQKGDGTVSQNNVGSTTVEATIILPLFIFFVLAFFQIARLRMAESIIYEAAIETVEYLAEFTYLEKSDVFLAKAKFKDYVDNQSLIEGYIVDGVEGVSFKDSIYLDDEGYVCLCINYQVSINVPLLGDLSGERSYVVRQKAYLGEEMDEEGEKVIQDDIYVYITDNKEAYHLSRSCSHLDLSITTTSLDKADKMGYQPCQFCGDGVNYGVFITQWGERYHSKSDCSGLKRTVYRVKKTQVEELGACERCGR